MSSSNGEHASVRQLLATIHQDLHELRQEVRADRLEREGACAKHLENVAREFEKRDAKLAGLERQSWYAMGLVAGVALFWDEMKRRIFK